MTVMSRTLKYSATLDIMIFFIERMGLEIMAPGRKDKVHQCENGYRTPWT